MIDMSRSSDTTGASRPGAAAGDGAGGADMGDDQDEAAGGSTRPLTTLEGWRRFVEQPGTAPQFPDLRGDPQDPDAVLDDPRLGYHTELAVVGTPMVRQVATAGRRLVVLNRRQRSARRGLIVTGDGGTGKSTAITHLGKTHELAVRRRHPDLDRGRSRIPVMYVTLPSGCTARMLAVEMARFLALPVTRRVNITDVTEAVCGVLTDTGCELVLIDELHNLSLTTRAGAEVSDHLKYFAERLPATFVYAGIDLEREGLFTGTRGRQIASRFTVVAARSFGRATRREREQWQALVATMEQTLRLRGHRRGSLPRLAGYLHDRTGGMIGSLSSLVRAAAVDAIITGAEQITRAGLDDVVLDHAAETHYRATRSPRRHADTGPVAGATRPQR